MCLNKSLTTLTSFLGVCQLFGMFEISSQGKEISRLFVNFIKVLCTFSITSKKYAKARGNGICAD